MFPYLRSDKVLFAKVKNSLLDQCFDLIYVPY